MKKSTLRNLGVMAVVLCLVTTSLLGGTLAKYTTEVTGTTTVTVAKWNFKANEQTSAFTFDLGNTKTTNIADGKIAPGTEGKFDIALDATGSEVNVSYKIAFEGADALPTNMKFYSDEACKNVITLADGMEGTLSVLGDSAVTTLTKTIYWKWAYDGDSKVDETDTEYAEKSDLAATTLTIKVTGTQVAPTVTSAP